jgi:hypothetical protein
MASRIFLSVRSFGSFLVCQLDSVIVFFSGFPRQLPCLVFARRAISVLTSWMLAYALPTLTVSGEKIELVFLFDLGVSLCPSHLVRRLLLFCFVCSY